MMVCELALRGGIALPGFFTSQWTARSAFRLSSEQLPCFRDQRGIEAFRYPREHPTKRSEVRRIPQLT